MHHFNKHTKSISSSTEQVIQAKMNIHPEYVFVGLLLFLWYTAQIYENSLRHSIPSFGFVEPNQFLSGFINISFSQRLKWFFPYFVDFCRIRFLHSKNNRMDFFIASIFECFGNSCAIRMFSAIFALNLQEEYGESY